MFRFVLSDIQALLYQFMGSADVPIRDEDLPIFQPWKIWIHLTGPVGIKTSLHSKFEFAQWARNKREARLLDAD